MDTLQFTNRFLFVVHEFPVWESSQMKLLREWSCTSLIMNGFISLVKHLRVDKSYNK